MARGRMLSRSLGSSRKFTELRDRAGELGEFAQVVYQLIIPHTDDFGRLSGDAFSVKFETYPTSPRSLEEFETALSRMVDVGLVDRYEVDGETYLQVVRFDEHQDLKSRTKSKYPPPPGADPGPLDSSEAEVEAIIAARLQGRTLLIPGLTVINIERQLRIGSSYLDLVCKTQEGPTLVLEIKRQRLSNAAIEQVRRYLDLLGVTEAIPVVIGHGLAANVDLENPRALLVTYDDALRFKTVASFPVNSRHLTLIDVTQGDVAAPDGQLTPVHRQPASVTTEPNGTEPKRSSKEDSCNESTVLRSKQAARYRKAPVRGKHSISGFEFEALFERVRDVTQEPDTRAKRAFYQGYADLIGITGVDEAISNTKQKIASPGGCRNPGGYLNRTLQGIAKRLGVAA